MSTTNLTLAIDEDILHEARVLAAKQKTSVNQMVRDYLTNLTKEVERREQAWKVVKALFDDPTVRVDGPPFLSRDELHER